MNAKFFHSLCAVSVCLLSVLCRPALAVNASESGILALPWAERVPFAYKDAEGKPAGILIDLGDRIFASSGIATQWGELPASRILLGLSDNKEAMCLVGWFKTPEREQIARISLPIYQDKPLRAVVQKVSSLANTISVNDIFGNAQINILVKQGYSYGATVDDLIKARGNQNLQSVTVAHSNMVQMMLAKRADVMFLPQEEIDYYLQSMPAFKSDLRVVAVPELRAGNLRHVICTKQVSAGAMQKINAAIKAKIKL